MKLTLMMIFVLSSSVVFGKEVKPDFTKTLLQDVQKDIDSDNDYKLKKNNSPMRGPASVEDVEVIDTEIKEDTKLDKNFKQIGGKNW